MSCNSNCPKGLISSKCVEFNETKVVYDELVELENSINTINLKFTKGVDSKTLGVGQDLILTVQALVDRNIQTNTVTTALSTLDVNLQCLTNSTTSLTQEQLFQLLINEICLLRNEVNILKTNNYV
jgi:hypothetical protein